MGFPGETFLGALIGAGSSAYTNYQNQKIAREQMAFQERMSSTAYQRAAEDMKAAGLNPALMYGSGTSASTPPGAKAELEDAITSGITTALALRKANAEIKNIEQMNQKLIAETDTERGKPYNIVGTVRRKGEKDVKDSKKPIATAKQQYKTNLAAPIMKQINKRNNLIHRLIRYVENPR